MEESMWFVMLFVVETIIISVIVSIVLFFQQDNFYTWKIYFEFGLQ